MSSVNNDPRLLDKLIQECLTPVLKSAPGQPRQEVKLSRIDDEPYIRQGGDIPQRLAAFVEESSNGAYAIRAASPLIADVAYALAQAVYFVRCPASYDGPNEVIEPDRTSMVLFEINPHRSVLTTSVPIRTPEGIEAALAEQAEKRAQERAREAAGVARRAAVDEELNRLIARIEFYVENSGDPEARRAWEQMRSHRNQYHGVITLLGLLELCHRLGIDLATLATHPVSHT